MRTEQEYGQKQISSPLPCKSPLPRKAPELFQDACAFLGLVSPTNDSVTVPSQVSWLRQDLGKVLEACFK